MFVQFFASDSLESVVYQEHFNSLYDHFDAFYKDQVHLFVMEDAATMDHYRVVEVPTILHFEHGDDCERYHIFYGPYDDSEEALAWML